MLRQKMSTVLKPLLSIIIDQKKNLEAYSKVWKVFLGFYAAENQKTDRESFKSMTVRATETDSVQTM